VPVRGTNKYLSNANLGDAAKWLGVFVADYLKKHKVTGPFLVVPVPNSDCVASSNTKPRTRKLAKAICDTLADGSAVLDCLRWKKNLGSASDHGGPRETEIPYGNPAVLRDLLKDADDHFSVLLVDDVTTSFHTYECTLEEYEPAGPVTREMNYGRIRGAITLLTQV